MWLVAGGIASVLHIDDSGGVALGYLATHESIVLSGINLAYKSLLGLEVISHRVALVLVGAHLEHWGTLDGVAVVLVTECLGGVLDAGRTDKAAVKAYVDFFTLEVHVLVIDVG